MTALPASFLARPIAHRALHDVQGGRPENSRAAIRAAVAAGYGIEVDVQMSSDHAAMVFHDYHLSRLAEGKGPIRQQSARALAEMPLIGGDEGIPSLPEVLQLVAGAVPLLIEVKDQDGAMGPGVGPLEEAVISALEGYRGDVAVMSFNPHSVEVFARRAPSLPRGLVTSAYRETDWPTLPKAVRQRLAPIPDFERLGASFVSHDWRDLQSAPVAAVKALGAAISCWTIRSPEEEAVARQVADTITFEGYLA